MTAHKAKPFVQDDGGLLDTAIDFIQGLLGGGGGSMSQDQAQVLQNVLRDLIDFEVGDITAETGDQQTDVDVQTDVDASSDVDVLAEGGMSDVDIGPQHRQQRLKKAPYKTIKRLLIRYLLVI